MRAQAGESGSTTAKWSPSTRTSSAVAPAPVAAATYASDWLIGTMSSAPPCTHQTGTASGTWRIGSTPASAGPGG